MEQKNRILLIDDDRDLLNLLYNCMNEKYEVNIAWNGKQGLDFLKQKKYSLILLDVILPGIDGFSILKKIAPSNRRYFHLFLFVFFQERAYGFTSKMAFFIPFT